MVVALAALLVGCGTGDGAEVPGVEAAPTRATPTQRHDTTPPAGTRPGSTPIKPTSAKEKPGGPQPSRVTTQPCDVEIAGVCAEPTPPACFGDSAGDCLRDALAREVAELESRDTEAAADQLAQLTELPSDPQEALSALSGYEWASPSAKDLYDRIREVNG